MQAIVGLVITALLSSEVCRASSEFEKGSTQVNKKENKRQWKRRDAPSNLRRTQVIENPTYYYDVEGYYDYDPSYYSQKQGGYYPQQGGYYPQQGGYYPQQGGYYPQQEPYYAPYGANTAQNVYDIPQGVASSGGNPWQPPSTGNPWNPQQPQWGDQGANGNWSGASSGKGKKTGKGGSTGKGTTKGGVKVNGGSWVGTGSSKSGGSKKGGTWSGNTPKGSKTGGSWGSTGSKSGGSKKGGSWTSPGASTTQGASSMYRKGSMKGTKKTTTSSNWGGNNGGANNWGGPGNQWGGSADYVQIGNFGCRDANNKETCLTYNGGATLTLTTCGLSSEAQLWSIVPTKMPIVEESFYIQHKVTGRCLSVPTTCPSGDVDAVIGLCGQPGTAFFDLGYGFSFVSEYCWTSDTTQSNEIAIGSADCSKVISTDGVGLLDTTWFAVHPMHMA